MSDLKHRRPLGSLRPLTTQILIQPTVKRSLRLLVVLTILAIDTKSYIPPKKKQRGRRRIPQSRLARWSVTTQGGSCLRTIVRRLPNLSAPKELPAAQLPACCRPKAWFLPPTGSRWKSTQLSVTAYAAHKPLLAGDHFQA